jgi:hypothetical protein
LCEATDENGAIRGERGCGVNGDLRSDIIEQEGGA